METLAPVWLCLRLALLAAGLLAPGAVVLRALRLPRSIGLCFAVSAVVLYGSALAIDFLSLRLSLGSLTLSLAAVTAAAWFAARRATPPTPSGPDGDSAWHAPFTRLGALTPVMLLFWAVIGFLLWREPLAGPDIQFRWAFLPEQWLRHGNLDFYPPVSPADFLSYFWVESIPPGVASLHAWAFACGGGFAPAWTIPVTALEFLALHDLAWRAGEAVGGADTARPSAVLAAACPLLNWSCRLGQETGLTTLAALGLALSLLRWQSHRGIASRFTAVLKTSGTPAPADAGVPHLDLQESTFRPPGRPAWIAAAGVFASLGAMTREYGLVFPALLLAALLFGRARRAAWVAFALAAVPLALAWPVRCAIRSGNPFYSLDVAGLLPVNPVFVAWINDHRALFGAALADGGGWLYVLRWLALGAGPALVGWIALVPAARRFRSAAFAGAAVMVFLGLWFVSVPFTVGGLFYSLRVASPAIAVGAVATGVLVARVRTPAVRVPLLGALLLATLPFTLLLPQNPLRVSSSEWPVPWRTPPPSAPAGAEQIVPAILAQHPSVVLTDSPGFQALLAPHGVSAIPFWSPQAAWLFDPKMSSADAARRWRESGLHVVVLSKFAPAVAFVNRRARWGGPPFRLQLLGETPGFLVFGVDAPSS